MSFIICWEEAGETKCEREEERRVREIEERLKQYLEAKLAELLSKLTQEHEIEITVNVAEGKGVGRWRRKQ